MPSLLLQRPELLTVFRSIYFCKLSDILDGTQRRPTAYMHSSQGIASFVHTGSSKELKQRRGTATFAK